MPTGANTIVIPWESIMHKANAVLNIQTDKKQGNNKDMHPADAYNIYTGMSSGITIKQYANKYRIRKGVKPAGNKKLYNVLSKMTPEEYTSMVSSFNKLPF